jgi:hypothetical protein
MTSSPPITERKYVAPLILVTIGAIRLPDHSSGRPKLAIGAVNFHTVSSEPYAVTAEAAGSSSVSLQLLQFHNFGRN